MTTTTDALATAQEPQYFTLQVGVAFCRCDVRVNDIPILTDDLSGSRVDVEMPLNQHVFTGENTVSFRLLPARSSEQGPSYSLDSPHVVCSVELVRKPYGREGPRTVLASLKYQGASPDPFAGSSAEGDGASAVQTAFEAREHAAAARVVTLATPFPEWRWVRAPAIEPGHETVRDLLAEHHRFWNALRAKDLAELRGMLAANAREMQAAYYLPDMEEAWRVVGIEELLRNPDARLLPMPTELSLEVFANGRLARLVDARGESPIAFHEGDTGLDAFISAWFCRAGAGGGWVMIR